MEILKILSIGVVAFFLMMVMGQFPVLAVAFTAIVITLLHLLFGED